MMRISTRIRISTTTSISTSISVRILDSVSRLVLGSVLRRRHSASQVPAEDLRPPSILILILILILVLPNGPLCVVRRHRVL